MPGEINPITLNEFQKIIDILITIQNKIDEETDIVWTRFDSIQQIDDYLTSCIKNLKINNYYVLAGLNLDFAPTGLYQEISISNGWTAEYLELADQFQTVYKKLRE